MLWGSSGGVMQCNDTIHSIHYCPLGGLERGKGGGGGLPSLFLVYSLFLVTIVVDRLIAVMFREGKGRFHSPFLDCFIG